MTILTQAATLTLLALPFTASALPITFTDGPDTLIVTQANRNDVAAIGDLNAGGGDDVINLSLHPDDEFIFPGRVFLGDGNDTFTGPTNGIILDAGAGDDTLFGGQHGGLIIGGPGNDTFQSGVDSTAMTWTYLGFDSIIGYYDNVLSGPGVDVRFNELTLDFINTHLYLLPIQNSGTSFQFVFPEFGGPFGEFHGLLTIGATTGIMSDFSHLVRPLPSIPEPPMVALFALGLMMMGIVFRTRLTDLVKS